MDYKFNVGDCVLVKEDAGLYPTKNGDPLSFNIEGKMDMYRGQSMIVKKQWKSSAYPRYTLEDCSKDLGGDWVFAEEWLEPCAGLKNIEDKDYINLFN